MSDEHDGGLEAELRAQLERVSGEPPYDEVDWDALARRIHIAALGRRAAARPRRWWEHAARWTRATVPLAVAAAIAAFALIMHDRPAPESSGAGTTLIEAVTGAAPDQDAAVSIVGQPTTESFAAEVLAQ